MKQTKNNEMDLLLRSWARRENASAVASGDNPAKHLDADELNSYAERALPDAARARYTSHLADCEICRKIVSELASAAGANISEHSASQKTSGGFLQKLWALLSPGRLRYAVPALALLAFIAVGLVIIRQQTQPQFMASTESMAEREVAIETRQTESVAAPEKPAANPAANDGRMVFDDSTKNTSKDKDNFAKSDERDKTSDASTTTGAVSVVAGDSGASPGKATGQVAQPSYAPEPPAAPAPKPQTTTQEARTDVASREKKEADKSDEELARSQEGERARTYDRENQVGRARPGSDAPAIQSADKTRQRQAKPASGAGAKAKAPQEEVETRTVSGRQFRRQGGIWIDTAFQSSSATTIITRGSEQFRALVADEPGIRAIAANLPGEVVVVWKGRAYRIR